MKKLKLYLMGAALAVNLIALDVCLMNCCDNPDTICIKQETISEIQPDTIYKTQLIDLGLPSGTLWADRNIGADAPEEYGDYFRFGEMVPFTENSPQYVYDANDDIAGTKKDAATVILGKNFCMPTHEQLEELRKKCKWKWIKLNKIKGMKVTGPNGNSIFFPVAGYRWRGDGSLHGVGSEGYYWSASAYGSDYAHILGFVSSYWTWGSLNREYGYNVRAVAKKSM